MNYLYIIIILSILSTFWYKQENLENENTLNYYTDSTGTHSITTLPITLNNITELKYVNHKGGKLSFNIISGPSKFTAFSSYNETNIINNVPTQTQTLYILNNTPFSGTLKLESN